MSRRAQIRMSEEELAGFLGGARTIIINSIGPGGVPHPMPMWFAMEPGGAIVMSTFTKSQKIRNLERDPRVALLVEDGETYGTLRGAVLYGEAELIRGEDAVTEILVQVNRRNVYESSAADDETIRSAVRRTAPKRTGIRIRPRRALTWDHRKLGGVY